MRTLFVLLFLTATIARAGEAARHTFPFAKAKVVRDVGGQGNITHGRLVDPGDSIAWTLEGIQPGVYRVELDVRTGARGEGTGFITSYRMAASARCFLSGRQRDVRFALSPDNAPRVTLAGRSWKLFRARVTADEKLILAPGVRLQVESSAHFANVYSLILTRLQGDELLGLDLAVDKYTSLFQEGEEVLLAASVLNYGATPAATRLVTRTDDETGKTVASSENNVTVPPRAVRVVELRPAVAKLGPYWISAALDLDGRMVDTKEANVAIVPRSNLATVPDSSAFGLHKGDLTDWPPIGAKWDRLWDTGDTWNRMQREPGPIDFGKQDRKVLDARRHDVNLLFVFAYTPTWASAHPEWPHYTGRGAAAAPNEIGTWESYVRQVVGRYRGNIDHFEVWNEPNAGFFKGTMAEYYELLRAAYRSAKRANPDSTVLGISGTGGYLPWMEKVFELGGLDWMDVVSVHTYTTPSSPESANLLGRLAATRALIAKYGAPRPIWNTEIGVWVPERSGARPLTDQEILAKAPEETRPNWKSSWPYRPINEVAAAPMLARHYILNLAGGVSHVFWYAWYTQSLPMYTVRGAPRLHTLAFAGAAARLGDAKYVERVDLGSSNLHVHLFAKPDGPMAVAWRVGDIPRKIGMASKAGARLWDLWGNKTAATGPRVELDLSDRPIYIMGPTVAEMRSTRLVGERFEFESPDAAVSREVAKKNVREMTSASFHGKRRVMGLPNAGDEIAWTLSGIDRAVYALSFEARAGGGYLESYRLRVSGPKSAELVVRPDPDRALEVTRRGPKYTMYYTRYLGAPAVELSAGDQVLVHSTAHWAYVGKLTLTKVAELPDVIVLPCTRVANAPDLDDDHWPATPALAINTRKQAVIGVADRFASTNEGDSWRGPDDLSATACVAWTAEALHLRVEVVDDRVVPPAAKQGPFGGDCVEVFLDLREGIALRQAALGDGVYQLFCPAPLHTETAPTVVKGKSPAPARAVGRRTAKGYVIAVAIPWGDHPPRPGRELGFDIAIDDADNAVAGRAQRKAQLVWHGTANNFQDPSAYGCLRLIDK